MLADPELAGLRMKCCSLRVAMPECPDLRERAILQEGRMCRAGVCRPARVDAVRHQGRVVRGYRAVREDPYHLAQRDLHPLRLVRVIPLAERHEQIAEAVEDEPPAEMAATANRGDLAIDDLDVVDGGIAERRTGDGGTCQPARHRLCEGEVDPPVVRESRAEGEVEQPTLALRADRWHSG